MNIIKPKFLKSGDTISIIATSGVVDEDKILKAKCYFENKGFNVKLGKNIFKKKVYLAGSDDERLEDLHCAFEDTSVNAIVCARGGYGAIRLANKIDYDLIKNNPKIFCGYSDITLLNALFLAKSNLITFSGPMAQSDFASDKISKFTEDNFWNTLFTNNTTVLPVSSEISLNSEISGYLFGGNLSSLVSLCGLDFIPDDEFIFFAEDLNESAYKLDRYFRQLLNITKFRNNVNAIICGEFMDVDLPDAFNQLLIDISNELKIPVFKNFPITHSMNKVTIPYGAWATLSNCGLHVSNYLSED